MRALASTLAAASLIGGYAVASRTKRRELGGAVLAAGGLACGVMWTKSAGAGPAVASLAVYLAAFGGSHPLAKKVGAWPSVLGVSATTAVITYALTAPRA